MYREPIFLQPVFQERIWGGEKLNTLFGYDIPNNRTGEAWVISAHKNGPTEIMNGPLKGDTLKQVWENYPALFGKGHTEESFPLLVKIIDAHDNLSVQVHPDDTYAKDVEGQPYGKTECWYVLDAEEDAEIIFGHHAQTKHAFCELVEKGEWEDLLHQVPVEKGDFIYVPSGTIHAIGKGIVILETQQSSDTTYRVYDYERKDADGNTRELHMASSLEVIDFPFAVKQQNTLSEWIGDLFQIRLVQADYFTVYHWQLNGTTNEPLHADYLLMSVIEGQGNIVTDDKDFTLQKGDHFILPASVRSYKLNGHMEMIVSHV